MKSVRINDKDKEAMQFHFLSAARVVQQALAKSCGYGWKVTSYIRPKTVSHEDGLAIDFAPNIPETHKWYAHNVGSDPVLFNRRGLMLKLKAAANIANRNPSLKVHLRALARILGVKAFAMFLAIEHNHGHLGAIATDSDVNSDRISVYGWKNLSDKRYKNSSLRYNSLIN